MNLAPLPVSKPNATGMATYNRHQNCLPTVFASPGSTQHCSGAKSHPALNGAFGCLPGDRYGVDRQIMNNTLAETLKVWSWDHCWGWDQPMVRACIFGSIMIYNLNETCCKAEDDLCN